MKKGTLKTLRINDETLQAEYIGKGSFSRVYRADDSVYIFLKIGPSWENTDFSKEILKNCVYSQHIPQIDYIGETETHIIYKMPFYNKLAVGSVPYKQAKILYKAWVKTWCNPKDDNFTNNHKFINSVESILPESIIKALREIVDESANYGLQYRLEFPLRNMAQDSEGNLILLDVLFNPYALKHYYKKS